jgi:hypothetical protein
VCRRNDNMGKALVEFSVEPPEDNRQRILLELGIILFRFLSLSIYPKCDSKSVPSLARVHSALTTLKHSYYLVGVS